MARRRRLRRAGGAGLALTLALVAVPVVSAGWDVAGGRRADDVAMTPPGTTATTAAGAPVWPLVAKTQIAAWFEDPIVGIVPDVTTAEATAWGFVHAVLGLAKDTLVTVRQVDPWRATATLVAPGQAEPGTAVRLDLTRFGAKGPWLVTNVTGRVVTIKTPSRGAVFKAGAVMTGTAPVHVTSVYAGCSPWTRIEVRK